MSGATPEPRTAVMILVEASWLENAGTLRSVTARMENRSVHGACIRIKARLGVGARVYIRSHREQFSGISRYCRVDGKEFLVGIQKDAVSWPMPKMPMPANILTPQTKREAPRPGEAAATTEKREQAGLKASATFKNNGPRREDVPHRVIGGAIDRAGYAADGESARGAAAEATGGGG